MDSSFQTDAQGNFDFKGLAFGNYRLEISRPGFANRTVTVNVTSAAPVSEVVKLLIRGTSTSVNVFSPTPIGLADVTLDQIPVPVQGLTAKNLEDSNSLDLADLMNHRLASVYINENAENPYQPDINYRGYTASPLLGTPEGLSVYLDGVRQNQPLGDIVAWDLIPKVAIRDMALIPGSTYHQLSQLGYLNPDNVSFTLVPIFLDGTTFSDGDPVDTQVLLHGTENTPSVYATDTLTYGRWAFTLSGRYNHTSLDNLDYLPLSAARGNLTSNNVFQRFNPAAGFTCRPTHLFETYFNYSEASRSPTSIELGCADPTQPCNLPNALVSDPPLKQVVTRNFEVGIRSNDSGTLHWSADYFFGQNYNDLLFVASEQTGFGYFLNFGRTRRDGVELELSHDWRQWSLGSNYTFLNATYQSAQTIDGGSNSTNNSSLVGMPGLDDDINITPGDFIPQVPRNIFKLYGQYHPSSKLTAELDVLAAGSSFARGNENNLDRPDGVYYNGSGKSAGYGVADIGARYQVTHRIRVFAQLNNLLDKHYYTAAQLGTTPFDNNDHFVARPFGTPYGTGDGDIPIRSSTFLAPGTPFNLYGGLKITLWSR